MTTAVVIRRARRAEHELLSTISYRSKAHWSYPEEYFRIWAKELTITPEYIERHEVYLCERQQEVAAYYSLVELSEDLLFSGARLPAGLWLDHMFVVPELLGCGIGRALFADCLARSLARGVARLNILADPHALGFYLKMGCSCHGQYPSSIPGRTTPYLVYAFPE